MRGGDGATRSSFDRLRMSATDNQDERYWEMGGRDGLCLFLVRPFALAHDRFRRAVGIHAVDVDLVGADHPVDVDV